MRAGQRNKYRWLIPHDNPQIISKDQLLTEEEILTVYIHAIEIQDTSIYPFMPLW